MLRADSVPLPGYRPEIDSGASGEALPSHQTIRLADRSSLEGFVGGGDRDGHVVRWPPTDGRPDARAPRGSLGADFVLDLQPQVS